MADETTNGAAAPQEQQAMPQLKILAQFIRDLSFENIAAQKGLQGDAQPDIQVQVNLDAKKRPADNQYEVAMKLNITAKTKDSGDMIFGLELEYAGVFHIENVPDEQMHPFLLIECPRMIFPFVRRIVSDVTRDGGFPPLNLDLIDFVALYRQELARRAAAQQAAPTAQA
ncbi:MULTISPECIES: protein-export chaperone SecB [unclassified Dinoroseobacter]|uniref:protein-export chaperone SecB n=1 Tax=unclassified Dinoroseobacter TaxID=2620028 RepID=UPI003C7EB16B